MPAWLKSKGLNTFEYQCGKGVRVSDSFAAAIRRKAEQSEVRLTLHAPYYINLATVDPEKAGKSSEYILSSLRAAQKIGADRIVVHPGSAKPERGPATQRASELLLQIIARADDEHLLDKITICPELMGKTNQLGDLQEIIDLCALDERLIPCIDFGHLNARTAGSLKSPDDYEAVLRQIENGLGTERMHRIHIHFSHIEYGKAGEIRHLTFEDRLYGPWFRDLAPVLIRLKMEPVIICESAGTQDKDALQIKALLYEAARDYAVGGY